MILVRVPLRTSFAGGGSDLPQHFEEHGGAVLSATINKYIYITAKPGVSLFKHKFRLVYSQVEECGLPEEIKHPIIKRLVLDYGHKSLDLDVMSDVPSGTGLGSSSAFTVGLHRALSRYSEYAKDRHLLAEAACRTEIVDLKEPIGKQDQYAAAFGGLSYFEFTKGRVVVSPISLAGQELSNLQNSLHLVYAGGSRSASKLLKEQFRNSNSEPLRRMALLAWYAKQDLERGSIEDIGPNIQEGWELKKEMSPNVSNERIDTIIETALNHGATGGKLLGAGGAGFVLLFCPVTNRDKMLSGLKPLNLAYVPFNFDQGGCRVLYED